MKYKVLIGLLLIGMMAFLPFLGLTDYNTKGEPREAIVAYSMLESGNWILPVSDGDDIAFKPPFFHWCVAAVSLVTGRVSEYTSRFPSAVALLVLMASTFLFYAKRKGTMVALLAALVLITNFETHRAAMNCRVDMVLTTFIVLALYALYRWIERGTRGFPWLSVLFMGIATLTKGPVGIILPCLVAGVYLWIRGTGFMRVAAKFLVVALASCVLPMVWYVAAYMQGGDDFLALVMEENLGRFTGSMSYESHENPIYYNFLTLLSGYAPYTILMLIAAVAYLRERVSRRLWSRRVSEWWYGLKSWVTGLDDVKLFSMLSAVLIFVFYCIPKSKRSVYLLPIYPFLAYFIAACMIRMAHSLPKMLKLYGGIVATLALLLSASFVAVKAGLVPDTVFHGKHAAQNIEYLHALRDVDFSGIKLFALIFMVVVSGDFLLRAGKRDGMICAIDSLIIAVSVFLVLDSSLQPAVLNVKSDKAMAAELRSRVPECELYSYSSVDMMRYFSVNFYNGDNVRLFEKELPSSGYLLSCEDDMRLLESKYAEYKFTESWDPHRRSCDTKRDVHLYRFKKMSASHE
jgi:4-amino-4-deoxy-L-arabinose transferase-like glycosyltransferase